MSQVNERKIEDARQRYLRRQREVNSKVNALHGSARTARGCLYEARRQGAAEVRNVLDVERERKQHLEDEAERQRREQRDGIYFWNKTTTLDA